MSSPIPQRKKFLLLFFFYFYCSSIFSQNKFVFPATVLTERIVDYYGTPVRDNYSWLENTNDTNVQKWIEKQNEFTADFLQASPYFSKLEKNIKEKDQFFLDFPVSKKKYFFKQFTSGEWSSKRVYEKSVPKLFYREKNDLQWKELINPDKFRSNENESVAITNYELSEDQNYLAFSISRNGSDWNEIRILDMGSKKILNDVIHWVKDNNIVWSKAGFFYQHYNKPPEGFELVAKNTSEQLCYHKLNTPSESDLIMPLVNCNRLEIINGNYLILYTSEIFKKKPYYVISFLNINNENWYKETPRKFAVYPQLTRYNVDVLQIKNDSALVKNNFLADKGMIVSFSLKGMNEFNIIVPEYNEVLVNAFFHSNKLHCLYKTDTSYMMVRINLQGEKEKFHDFGSYMNVLDFDFETKSTAYYSKMSFDRPKVLYRFNFDSYESGIVHTTSIKYEVNDYVIKRVEYTAADGTKVPMTLFYKEGLIITENTPLILSAYGGFGLINNPGYNFTNIVWVENGGIYAEAYIRGGGEKGKKWHVDGSVRNKQRGIDDFISAANFLITNKYTSPQRLAITGASHGGLIVAAAVNQRPDLFKAAIPVVGLYDMLNYQNYTVGNHFSDEFGTVSDSLDFINLLKYSPLHNVKKEGSYPAILVMTGDHDDRVPPFNSYKYVAEVQRQSDKTNPILLHVNRNAGHHGAYTSKANVIEKAYMLTFLFETMKIKPVLVN